MTGFETHAVRGRFNAGFFTALDGYINWLTREKKRKVFSLLRTIQHAARRPWAWAFEGCSCERDLAAVVRAAGFASVDIDEYRLRSPFLPANAQIAGTAIA